MDRLGRYPLSVVLSYLSETDGTCLLLTRRCYAHDLLPGFRLGVKPVTLPMNGAPSDIDEDCHGDEEDGAPPPRHRRPHRHAFVVCPAQDVTVLLARLNTRKLARRRAPGACVGCSTAERARREWGAAWAAATEADPGTDTRDGPLEQFPPDQLLLQLRGRPSSSSLPSPGTAFDGRGLALLASYPRSGNSLLRTLLERVTGLVTGSDARPDRFLARRLAECHGLVGEGLGAAPRPEDRVAFLKTHWPERDGVRPVAAPRAVLLVRNPYDAIDSYWNMNATRSHDETLAGEVYERFVDKFQALVRNEAVVWDRFHRYWTKRVAAPVLLVRYEDLVRDPAHELTRVLRFALGLDTLPRFWRDRVRHVTEWTGIDRLGPYHPRAAGGDDPYSAAAPCATSSIGKSIRKGRYSDELLQAIHDAAAGSSYGEGHGGDLLECLGYADLAATGQLRPPAPEMQLLRGDSRDSITINEGALVRPLSCPFGRALTAWRQSVTDNDARPLPTVPRHRRRRNGAT